MEKVVSKDGTAIAYDQTGQGPALIVVDGALCSRGFGPTPKLAPLLAKHFTVITYDRRGRGDSGDTKPYAKEREIEDIDALIQKAGGKAYLLGFSSGAALALEAAAKLKVAKLAVYEPPYMVDDGGHHARQNHEAQLTQLVSEGKRAAAVVYFMRKMVGVPAPFVFMMRLMPSVWRKLKAVAHTLPYDAAVMGDWQPPVQRLAQVTSPTLAMHGGKTEPRLVSAVEAVTRALPNVQQRVLAGQNHNVSPEVLTPALVEFFGN